MSFASARSVDATTFVALRAEAITAAATRRVPSEAFALRHIPIPLSFAGGITTYGSRTNLRNRPDFLYDCHASPRIASSVQRPLRRPFLSSPTTINEAPKRDDLESQPATKPARRVRTAPLFTTTVEKTAAAVDVGRTLALDGCRPQAQGSTMGATDHAAADDIRPDHAATVGPFTPPITLAKR